MQLTAGQAAKERFLLFNMYTRDIVSVQVNGKTAERLFPDRADAQSWTTRDCFDRIRPDEYDNRFDVSGLLKEGENEILVVYENLGHAHGYFPMEELAGISVAGIGSLLAFGAAIFYAFIQYGVLIGLVTLTAAVLLSVLAVFISLRANTWQRLSLKATIDSTSTPTPQQNNILVGQTGTTLTRLAPMGKVRVGEVTAEAKTIDGYINPRQSVEVIGFENTVVIVRAVHHKQQESINQI